MTTAQPDLLLRGGRIVTPAGVLDSGWVLVHDALIADVGVGTPAEVTGADVVDLQGRWVLPGFVDLHMHGGGGHDVTTSPEALSAAVEFHRAHGTTRTLVSR